MIMFYLVYLLALDLLSLVELVLSEEMIMTWLPIQLYLVYQLTRIGTVVTQIRGASSSVIDGCIRDELEGEAQMLAFELLLASVYMG